MFPHKELCYILRGLLSFIFRIIKTLKQIWCLCHHSYCYLSQFNLLKRALIISKFLSNLALYGQFLSGIGLNQREHSLFILLCFLMIGCCCWLVAQSGQVSTCPDSSSNGHRLLQNLFYTGYQDYILQDDICCQDLTALPMPACINLCCSGSALWRREHCI